MNNSISQGEVRPPVTPGDPYAEPYSVPLFALRRREWRVISPDECRLGPRCLICEWRRAGLLDPPMYAPETVVREADQDYGVCPSSYCPGCGSFRCGCPPDGYEDALAEQAYQLGYDHGRVDGPENRPDRRWLAHAGLEALADEYLAGYDDACAPVSWPDEDAVEAPR